MLKAWRAPGGLAERQSTCLLDATASDLFDATGTRERVHRTPHRSPSRAEFSPVRNPSCYGQSFATVERPCQISLDVALKTGGLHCRHFHLASCPRSRRKFRSG